MGEMNKDNNSDYLFSHVAKPVFQNFLSWLIEEKPIYRKCHWLISLSENKTTNHAEALTEEREEKNVIWVLVFHLEETSGHMLKLSCHL